MIELAWIVGSVVMGWIANQRGRNGFGWFLLSLAVSPLLSAVFLIAAGAAVRPPVCVGPVVVPNRAPALTALGIVPLSSQSLSLLSSPSRGRRMLEAFQR